MTFNDVLFELLAKLQADNKPILLIWDAIQQWPEHALESFLQLDLMSPASAAQSVECNGCEKACFMDIITLPHDDPSLSRAFIICDDSDMQSQIGRVMVSWVRLQQWQSSIQQLAKVLAELLGFKDKIEFTVNQLVVRLGMLKGDKGRRWVSLNCADLSLEINQHALPVRELLYFENKQLFIDHDCITDLLNRKPLQQGKTYTPSTNRREARKLETQAMYQDWKDAYIEISQLHPNKSKRWCSQQLAKMDISKGKDSETIRKNMIL